VELFHKGERVAVHIRGGLRGRHTTLAACRARSSTTA